MPNRASQRTSTSVARVTYPEELRGAFSAPDYYCPPADVLAVEIARPLHGRLNVLHTPSALKADVYLAGADPLHQWALALRRRFEIGGHEIWVAPPEYVILRKLLFFQEGGSSKHVRGTSGRSSPRKAKSWISRRSSASRPSAVWASS